MPPERIRGLTPISDLRVSRHYIPSHGHLPNTAVQNKPLMIYHSAFPLSLPGSSYASAVESHLLAVGVVQPQWRYTMYATTHFHSTTHEVLCVTHGRARLCFGGEDNPSRVEPIVETGDVIIVPAGVAHRLNEDLGGFQMVGSYPTGSDSWDMCYGAPEELHKIESIKSLQWFINDPIYGDKGPVVE